MSQSQPRALPIIRAISHSEVSTISCPRKRLRTQPSTSNRLNNTRWALGRAAWRRRRQRIINNSSRRQICKILPQRIIVRVIKPADKSQQPPGPIITTELLSIHQCANQKTLKRQHLQSSRLISAVSITCPRKTSTRSIIYSNLVPMSVVRLESEAKVLLAAIILTLPISNSY